MKFLILFITFCAAGVLAELNAEEQQKVNLAQLEKMLEEIEKDSEKLKPIADTDPSFSDAMHKFIKQFKNASLFSIFFYRKFNFHFHLQLTKAYVDVLNSVNHSLGLPRYPKLPGLLRYRRGILDQPVIKQIWENLGQVGSSIQDVGQTVGKIVSSATDDTRRTILKQFHDFTNLWSNQLGELSRMMNPDQNMFRAENETLLERINNQLAQLRNRLQSMQNYIREVLENTRKRVVGETAN